MKTPNPFKPLLFLVLLVAGGLVLTGCVKQKNCTANTDDQVLITGDLYYLSHKEAYIIYEDSLGTHTQKLVPSTIPIKYRKLNIPVRLVCDYYIKGVSFPESYGEYGSVKCIESIE